MKSQSSLDLSRGLPTLQRWGAVGLLTGILTVAGNPVIADEGFLGTEFEVLGGAASRSVRWDDLAPSMVVAPTSSLGQIGDEGNEDTPSEFQVAPEEKKPETDQESEGSPGNGRKVKAGLLSLLWPGAGQLYIGDKTKGYIMGGVEVGIWTAYFVFDQQGDSRMSSAVDWAGVYAGTSGDHPDSYWQDVGKYRNSDAYYESQLREARALGEVPPPPPSSSDQWQWVNEDRRYGYAQLRSDGNSAYDRRDFMILFAVLNRVVSVVDAVIGAGKKDGTLDAEVMGMNLELEMLPSWKDPGARFVVSRSF